MKKVTENMNCEFMGKRFCKRNNKLTDYHLLGKLLYNRSGIGIKYLSGHSLPKFINVRVKILVNNGYVSEVVNKKSQRKFYITNDGIRAYIKMVLQYNKQGCFRNWDRMVHPY